MQLQYEHLLGRAYEPGRVHCYTLVRDFYRDNFGFELGNYSIPNDWDPDKLNLIDIIREKEGFNKVPDWELGKLHPGDIMCAAVGSQNPSHLLVYLGDNKLVHHPLMKLSEVSPMRSFWRSSTCFVARHPDVPDLTPERPTVSILELARARYSVQAAE